MGDIATDTDIAVDNDTRIDLHNHTILSDGRLDLFELVELKREFLDVLCITDHYPLYWDAFDRGLEMKDLYQRRKGWDDLIVIMGMEYSLKNMIEVLVFGEDCIKDIIRYRPETDNELSEILDANNSAAVICHPTRGHELANETLLSLVDGVEVSCRGTYLEQYEGLFHAVKDRYGLNLLSNSDFHSHIFTPHNTYNIFKNRKIRDEDDLIQTLKDEPDIINIFDRCPQLAGKV